MYKFHTHPVMLVIKISPTEPKTTLCAGGIRLNIFIGSWVTLGLIKITYD